MATDMKGISIRINSDLKAQVDAVSERLGLPLSTAILMFLNSLARNQALPQELSMEAHIDADLIKKAAAVTQEMGLPLSTATTMFLKSIVRNQSIPKELDTLEETPD